MTGVIFTVMAKGLLRDRGAIAMSVLLPVAVFLVFAAIFAGASGESLRVRVALGDEQRTDASQRLVRALRADAALEVEGPMAADSVRERVRAGAVDVGLVIRGDTRPLTDLAGDGAPPIAIVVDPVRAVAGQMLMGRVQRLYFVALPDVALRSTADLIDQGFVRFTPSQRDTLELALGALRGSLDSAPDLSGAGPFDGLMARETVAGAGRAGNDVAYYAGAIAVLFLLFSAVHGALTLLEERDAGLLDRVLAGPGGMGAVIGGKFLFLLVQGGVQVSVIFVVAWGLYGVRLPDHLVGYGVVTTAAVTAAAGLALLLTTLSRTRRQAQVLANVTILVLAAIGGSMVPRFLMPPLLQRLGWFTPTTWAVEAYSGLFWRGDPWQALLLPVALLFSTGIAALAAAGWIARRDAVL
jgi:ABC-2 type transport system permease protein